MAGKHTIPVINMKGESVERSEKLMSAFKEWVCFRIINHGISPELMAEMKAVSCELSDLPVEIKMRNYHPVHGKGYTPRNQGSPVYEGLACNDMASLPELDAFLDQLQATPWQREIVTKYSKAIDALSMELGKELANGFGLVENDHFNGWRCQLRINKYNYKPGYVGSPGVILHTDPGFLAVLQDDELVGGLEIVPKETDEFVPVHPMEGSLFVNLGDIAQVWSNGRLPSVKHRVQCYDGSRDRVSIVCFVLGPQVGALEAPLQLVDSDHPRLYKAINFEDYTMLRNSNKSPFGAINCLLKES